METADAKGRHSISRLEETEIADARQRVPTGDETKNGVPSSKQLLRLLLFGGLLGHGGGGLGEGVLEAVPFRVLGSFPDLEVADLNALAGDGESYVGLGGLEEV